MEANADTLLPTDPADTLTAPAAGDPQIVVHAATNDARRASLRALMERKQCIRVLEVHSPISAILAENLSVKDASGEVAEFDAFWSSSLTDSTSRGLPDNEVLTPRERLAGINAIFAVTSKPLIMDGDTGGHPEHLRVLVRDLDRSGVSAVIIEDKAGLKQNSLLGASDSQHLADTEAFCEKIRAAKEAQVTSDFQVFARLESLILGDSLAHALSRADAYVGAGVDGIMIHSRQSTGDEVLAFAEAFRARHPDVPLIAVPTTYNRLYADDLASVGFNVIIYANHMLRAALKAMQEVGESILIHGRAAEAEADCVDLGAVLHLDAEVDSPQPAAAAQPADAEN